MPIIQPSNLSRQKEFGTAPNGVTQWSGMNALPYLPSGAMQSAQPYFYGTAYPLQFYLIEGATADTAAGQQAEWNALGRNLHAVAVSTASGTTFSATVLIEATLDGVNWLTIASITTTEIQQFSGLYQSLRASITAYTSGTISVTSVMQRS